MHARISTILCLKLFFITLHLKLFITLHLWDPVRDRCSLHNTIVWNFSWQPDPFPQCFGHNFTHLHTYDKYFIPVNCSTIICQKLSLLHNNRSATSPQNFTLLRLETWATHAPCWLHTLCSQLFMLHKKTSKKFLNCSGYTWDMHCLRCISSVDGFSILWSQVFPVTLHLWDLRYMAVAHSTILLLHNFLLHTSPQLSQLFPATLHLWAWRPVACSQILLCLNVVASQYFDCSFY